jgi:hypothetical protein
LLVSGWTCRRASGRLGRPTRERGGSRAAWAPGRPARPPVVMWAAHRRWSWPGFLCEIERLGPRLSVWHDRHASPRSEEATRACPGVRARATRHGQTQRTVHVRPVPPHPRTGTATCRARRRGATHPSRLAVYEPWARMHGPGLGSRPKKNKT